MSEPRGGFNIKPALQWLLIAALAVVALVYFGLPLRAADEAIEPALVSTAPGNHAAN